MALTIAARSAEIEVQGHGDRRTRSRRKAASNLRNYVLVTAAYWADTLTDGAIRMLVLLYFNQLGYSAIQVAMLFLFYEVFGIVTNLVGGWLAARLGLKTTLFAGLGMQVVALSMLAWSSRPGSPSPTSWSPRRSRASPKT